MAGEAGCAATTLDTVERLAPEAVLLDVRLGGDDGFDVCSCADVRATRARGAPHLDLRRPTRVVARRLATLGAARAASRTRPLGPCLSRRGCPAPPPQATRRRDARMPRGDPHAEGRRSDRKAQQRVEIDGLAVDSRVHRRGGAYLQRRCAPRSDGRVRAVPWRVEHEDPELRAVEVGPRRRHRRRLEGVRIVRHQHDCRGCSPRSSISCSGGAGELEPSTALAVSSTVRSFACR